MNMTQLFLDELDREAARTRRVLENVPAGHDDWKPHDKSMPFGRLAGLVASMPSWVTLILEQDELDLTPPGGGRFQPPATSQLVETLDGHVEKGRASLSKTNDTFLLTTNWRLRAGGQVVLERSAPHRPSRHAEPSRPSSRPADGVPAVVESARSGSLRPVRRRPAIPVTCPALFWSSGCSRLLRYGSHRRRRRGTTRSMATSPIWGGS